jgi:uncharacterized protein with HEPN domain
MPRSLALYLHDILKAIDSIFEFTSGIDKSAYDASRLVQAAVEREFSIIGEAMVQMRRHHPISMQQIQDSGKIIGFRNVLVHNYAAVDQDDVWSAIHSKLPDLRLQIASVLEVKNQTPTP